MNWRLASVMFTLVSVVVIGILVTIALVAGYDKANAVMLTIALGFLLSLPLTYMVTSRLVEFSATQK
ncbi:hypothetical protein FK216_15275 [Moraxellaceae bacterium AER2_44_116]|jgi:hypothetical protein|nr:hypothetical protein [Moraxellaceae bacterium]TQC94895.1 hypothetical protein FK216_15275 [Moraxellaceae bacterium AER2_44_116]